MKALIYAFLVLHLVVLEASGNDEVERLIKWFRSKGGYFSENIMYGSEDGTQPSIGGIFARSSIEKGERIIVLPNSALITSGISEDRCDTARALVKEYQLKSNSDYEPYVKYLFESFSHENLPMAWSDTAKKLVATLVGKELEPQNFAQESYHQRCRSDNGSDERAKNDGILEAAWRIVIARSWRDKMLPVIDMLNHRNGQFHNVDQANSAHHGEDIVVVALRDIAEGEELYNSYNECPDEDCAGIALTFGVPQILNEYGFVENYPRRFNFETNAGFIVFELDTSEESGELEVTWLSPKQPLMQHINWLRGHLDRLISLNHTISFGIVQLQKNEQYSIMAYYQALVEAMEKATKPWEDPPLEDPPVHVHANINVEKYLVNCNGDDRLCVDYDGLEKRHDPLQYHNYICDADVRDHPKGTIIHVDQLKSHYQNIEYKYFYDFETRTMDKVLMLDGWLHSSSSYRPHYHEWLVHYPATFLKRVTRVLFMGAGDSMILHELLKYPQIELAVGLELDQAVVRSSFKHFDTQPHFDDERVKWWFGDASKTLQILPDDYYGSFDLVVIDLLSYVVESLMVQDLNILDAAMQLLNPEGIISYNDDFVSRTHGDYAKYMVDLNFLDVPIICQTHVNIGSNGVDFFRADQYDHDIEAIIVNKETAMKQKYDTWFNYRTRVDEATNSTTTTTVPQSKDVRTQSATLTLLDSKGVIVILEVEGGTRARNSTRLVDILDEVGFTVFSSFFPSANILIIALQEGYIQSRSWLEHNSTYHAFDIMLWHKHDLVDELCDRLVFATDGKSSSSYSILTSGIRRSDQGHNFQNSKKQMKVNNLNGINQDNSQGRSSKLQALGIFTREMLISVLQPETLVVLVACPQQESACKSLETLSYNDGTEDVKVIPLWSCSTEENSQGKSACEARILDVMRSATSHDKINGIIFDPESSKQLGQILHKILKNTKARNEMLAQNFIVFAATSDSTEVWREILMERFRTQIVLFSPAHQAQFVYSDDSRLYQMDLFCSGDTSFYEHLLHSIETCEKTIDASVEVHFVKDALLNYIADFEATKTGKDSDYENTSPHEQWESQHSLGMQTIFQFEVQLPLIPFSQGDKVLFAVNKHSFVGTWAPATISSKNSDGTYNVIDLSGKYLHGLDRTSLQEWDNESYLHVGPEQVLIGIEDLWFQGKVLEKLPGATYKLHVYDNFGSIAIVHQDNLMKRKTNFDQSHPTTNISIDFLKELLREATTDTTYGSVSVEVLHDYMHDGKRIGCVIAAFWSQGNAIITWDAGNEINLNLFTFEEDSEQHKTFGNTFIEETELLALVSHNQQPRGFGRVMNFKRDVQMHL